MATEARMAKAIRSEWRKSEGVPLGLSRGEKREAWAWIALSACAAVATVIIEAVAR